MPVTDGTILSGGFTVDLDNASLTVIVNSCSFNRPGNTILQTDENDEPNAAIHYNGFGTGTMNIQVSAAAGQADFRGDTFTTSSITGSSKAFNIVGSNLSRSKSGLVTGDLEFAEDISA